MTHPPPSQSEIDRLCELASVGAVLASAAFGRLIGGAFRHGAPRVYGSDDPTDRERWCTGIFFEAAGDLTGIVAIVLPESDRDVALAKMLGDPDPRGDLVESALRELGNIVASHTVSAIADSLDATILLSVPKLVMRDAGRALRSLVAPRGAQLRVETDLIDPEGGVRALLVFAPDSPKPDPA